MGDALIAHGLQHRGKVALQSGWGQVNRGAADQRHEDFGDRGVEAQRRFLQQPVLGAEPHGAHIPQFVVAQGAVRNDHALGLAGGARGEDHQGRVVGAGVGRNRVAKDGGQAGRVGVQKLQGGMVCRRGFAEDGMQSFLRENHAGIGVPQNAAQALGGNIGIQRHIGAVGLEHGEQRHDERWAALHHHGHVDVASYAEAA